jgi:hypothetical protein
MTRHLLTAGAALAIFASPLVAQSADAEAAPVSAVASDGIPAVAPDSGLAGPRLSALGVTFAVDSSATIAADTGDTRPKAIEYSNGYGTRLAIHRYASYAELPLFATEYVLGEKILHGQRTGDLASSGTRSAHSVVAGALGALFAVNTVTGVWNMIEARHDPSGRTRRNLHALTMLLADAGFLYTASLAGGAKETDAGANKHRNAAIASISVATASTLMMWLWKD